MGVIATYMSEPMVSGFTSAVAIHVTISQAKHILGITGVPRFNGVFKAVRVSGRTLCILFTLIWTH